MINNKIKDITYLTTAKENEYFDRKSARKKPKELLKHIVSFANANGGYLIIGIEDDGKITGFKDSKAYDINKFKELPYQLTETPISFETIELDVENIKGEMDKILIISIKVSIDRVIKAPDNKVYLRQNDKSVILNYEQTTQLYYDRGQRSFEDEPVENSSIKDIDTKLLKEYKKLLNIENYSDLDVLEARHLIRDDGKLTNAGVLLFSKNPTKFLIQARVKIIRIAGNELLPGENFNVIKEKTFDSPIPKIIEEIKEFINSQLREFQNLTHSGVFKKMPEYPEFAWFEGIVNSLTHRNYSIRGNHIKVFLYDNRLEIHSPGLLPNIVTVENIKNKQYSRNPRIARILSEFGWVKEMNEGVKRIYSEMENALLNAPVFRENDEKVILTLENNIVHRSIRTHNKLEEHLTPELFNSLSEYEKKIINYAYSHNKITAKEIADSFNISRNTAIKLLKNLQKQKILIWNGTSVRDKNQYYTINLN